MASTENMTLNLKIWRQSNPTSEGKLVDYRVDNVSPDMSFLEMIDVLNEQLINKGEDRIAFDHDCREGICGMCSMMIDGKAHGGFKSTTTCQVHMRLYKNGDTIVIEPFRASAFPIISSSMKPIRGEVTRHKISARPTPPLRSGPIIAATTIERPTQIPIIII